MEANQEKTGAALSLKGSLSDAFDDTFVRYAPFYCRGLGMWVNVFPSGKSSCTYVGFSYDTALMPTELVAVPRSTGVKREGDTLKVSFGSTYTRHVQPVCSE